MHFLMELSASYRIIAFTEEQSQSHLVLLHSNLFTHDILISTAFPSNLSTKILLQQLAPMHLSAQQGGEFGPLPPFRFVQIWLCALKGIPYLSYVTITAAKCRYLAIRFRSIYARPLPSLPQARALYKGSGGNVSIRSLESERAREIHSTPTVKLKKR